MKKNTFKLMALTAVFGTGIVATSCQDTLDADKYFDDRMTLESVFTDVNQTNDWLSTAFSYLGGHLCDVSTKEQNGRNFHVFADDIFWGDRDSSVEGNWAKSDSYSAYKQGDYNEEYGSIFWRNAYRGIFQCSVFIHNIYRQNQLTEVEKTDLKGQARFLRAYYYWMLLRKFGPVPIMPDEGADYTLDYSELSFPRASYDEVVEYICDEMLKAAGELRSWSVTVGNTSPENAVRPTRGACLATRALALVYAASPLANGQLANGTHSSIVKDDFVNSFVDNTGKQLVSKTYDESKWARAAAACRDVMECPANYQLYHVGRFETNNEATGYPRTLTPYKDGDFSEKNWPEGYKDIDPYLSYRDFFNGVAGLQNSEIIFSRGYNTTMPGEGAWYSMDALVVHTLPTTLFGYNCHGVTQKMVDAYYMADGSDCDGMNSEWRQYYTDPEDYNTRPRTKGWTAAVANEANNEYDVNDYPQIKTGVSLQYANREPRFYASVGFNGSVWWTQNPAIAKHDPQIFYYRGGSGTPSSEGGGDNGINNSSTYWQRTGIAFKKYVNPADWGTYKGDYSHVVRKWEPALRFADILLYYAECINELSASYSVPSWDGSTTYTLSRNVAEMKKGIRPVRCRAGVPDYTDDVYGDQRKMRKKIKRERMIEFIGEGKRYYDLRRWMDAPVEEAIPVYGCNVYMPVSKRDDFQTIVPVYSLPTVFNKKMYFWPISTAELKRNKNLLQNPGWKYYD